MSDAVAIQSINEHTDRATLTADTVVDITTDQGATAGDADITVTIDWF